MFLVNQKQMFFIEEKIWFSLSRAFFQKAPGLVPVPWAAGPGFGPGSKARVQGPGSGPGACVPGGSWGLLGPPRASWGLLRPPGASWGLLGPSGASWGLVGLLETFCREGNLGGHRVHLALECDCSGRPSSMYMWSPHDIGRESWVWEEQEAL